MAQPIEAAATHLWIGIDHGRHHTPHAGLNERGHARRRSTLMRARLQRHVSRTAARAGACLPQRPDLRMIPVGISVPALADDSPVPNDNASHRGVWTGLANPSRGQPERRPHVMPVFRVSESRSIATLREDFKTSVTKLR